MLDALIVAAGGAIGAALRHAINVAAQRIDSTGFPWWTMAINVAGSLAMGLLVGWLASKGETSSQVRLFAATGILGGFTTFSAFSMDFAVLWEQGAVTQALAYAGISVAGALAAVFAGLWLARLAS